MFEYSSPSYNPPPRRSPPPRRGPPPRRSRIFKLIRTLPKPPKIFNKVKEGVKKTYEKIAKGKSVISSLV